MNRERSNNMIEPEFNRTEEVLPDNTPVRRYTIRLSDKQVKTLNSISSRNFAGANLSVRSEAQVFCKIVSQICEHYRQDESLDNYD